ncbi:MAG: hypothetical protein K0S47_838 [Herbinix sp.]|nr:hypothetical protein [Herbinix sp.]
MKSDLIIIGAGASGLVAAIAAAREGSKVLILEHKEKAGKKILATGNGKCNYTNTTQTPKCYRSDDSAFATNVLSCFDVKKTISFFEDLGIYPKERSGYLYPYSETAVSVLQVLLMECERLGVNIEYNVHVSKIEQPFYTIKTDHGNYTAKKLILATGGCASANLGSDGSGYELAKNLGHTIIKPLPALVSLKSTEKYCKTISGVRINACVQAYHGTNLLDKEEGEIIFTDYGISGIPIMQMSRFVAKALDKKQTVHVILDFMSGLTKENVFEFLSSRQKHCGNKTTEQLYIGLFHNKLAYIMIKEAKIDPLLPANKLSNKDLNALVQKIKEFTMVINDTNTFEHAQVCAGGVSTKEVDPKTLESKKRKYLYLVGELLDVDGTCGGYNLQWAWSTGYLAGKAAAKSLVH